MQKRYALVRQLYGWSHEQAMLELQQLCTHLACAANHEVGGRKTFWVSGELADALRQTNLDIAGDVLALPFDSCAFVFTDPTTLGVVDQLISANVSDRRARYRTLTVYVFPSGHSGRSLACGHGGEAGFDFVFMADSYDGEWPYMISRSVPTDGKRNLDEILQSHPEESTDAFFWASELSSLLHLVINAVLYTTSGDCRHEVRGPATPALRGTNRRAQLSSEQVYYLPGRILVGSPEASPPHRGEGGEKRTGTTVQKRFWVRGHWRRANPNWQDQRLRWVAPYLKGPELAMIIEREYELRGRPQPPHPIERRM
jgi:hypothetical protein